MGRSKSVWHRLRVGFAGVLFALLSSACALPQQTAGAALETTTQERLLSEPWWPTMATAPLKAYTGAGTCAQCHSEGSNTTAMQHAAETAEASTFLTSARSASIEAAALHYQLAATPQGLEYSVAKSDQTLRQKLAWVIGAGDLGRTFLYQVDGRWQQSEVSFYTQPASLDITTGLARPGETSLQAALGQSLSPQDARACFSCHTVHATTSAGLEPLHAEAGLGCEACHGPGRNHVTRMAAHATASDHEQAAIFDPSTLSPADSIDFCGACHRTSADAKLSTTQAFGSSSIRFQPYRLQQSKCWRATQDQRLTCVACHNPHKPLDRNPVSYDKQCLQCHAPSLTTPTAAHVTLICPKATTNCVSCHMPKVNVASMHGDFTDHYIRIVRAGDLTAQ